MSIIKINCDLNNYNSTTSGISQRRDVAKKRLRLLVPEKASHQHCDDKQRHDICVKTTFVSTTTTATATTTASIATSKTATGLPSTDISIHSLAQELLVSADEAKTLRMTDEMTATLSRLKFFSSGPPITDTLLAAFSSFSVTFLPTSPTPPAASSATKPSSKSLSSSEAGVSITSQRRKPISKSSVNARLALSNKLKNTFNLKILKYLEKCFTLKFILMIFILNVVRPACGLLVVDPNVLDGVADSNSDIVGSGGSISISEAGSSSSNHHHNHHHNGSGSTSSGGSSSGSSSSSSNGGTGGGGGHYLDKLDNLERSVAAVLIKVAYGTTSTTKRSIPDNSYIPSLTTIATPPLTTLRYLEKSAHQQQINLHHRNYELDLERDHALPTSAPNADILKSNSNPTYPNPNRHHNHDRDRHRHLLNSTPSPSLPNMLKKSQPTIPMYPGDMPSYSPPARSFFTPPLPPEYQNPFADKPTLRGTNNEGVIVNTGTYINRRPIPPPSLMPGHERIPFRPPDLSGGSIAIPNNPIGGGDFSATSHRPQLPLDQDGQRKKALNTPSQKLGNRGIGTGVENYGDSVVNTVPLLEITDHNPRQEHLPSIRRILSGSNGRKEDIPEVLLKQVTSRPAYNHQPPSSPVVVVQTSPENVPEINGRGGGSSGNQNPNINQSKHFDLASGSSGVDNSDDSDESNEREDQETGQNEPKTQPKIKMSTKSTDTPNTASGNKQQKHQHHQNAPSSSFSSSSSSSSTSSTTASSATASSSSSSSSSTKQNTATWSVAWNIHVYLTVILFTILGVYSIFKMIFYNKLTHLFSQSYFICIHLILITICIARIFYLCYDAYNIHSTFNLFVSEMLLNLPATFLTISFSVLILFLLIKSLNHKNNRYSALIRPLTVVVGSGVHVVLCITLHYVESYTTNHSQQFYYQQLYRNGLYHRAAAANSNNNVLQQHHLLQPSLHHHHQLTIPPPPPPRVLSLICQIIYIFICLSLGLLYLYIYRILKRILRSKSQNYIHGFQNLSYAIHITIATALLFVLLALLQIFGAISISTTRPFITSSSDMDWLQWGYQFSLRLIEIAIITLMSWVAGLKTSAGGGGAGVGVGGMGPGGGGMHREKNVDSGHNVAGFFLPCTSSSSQEQFETDYPAMCNANTNLHTYTLRTGKQIYDDTFALNSLGGGQGSMGGSSQRNDFQLQSTNNFVRPYDTGSLQSGSGMGSHMHSRQQIDAQSGHHSDFLTDTQTDHYENPNFELRATSNRVPDQHQYSDNCYSEPLNGGGSSTSGYDFSNFERPKFGGGVREANIQPDTILDRPMSRNNDRTSNSSRHHHRSNLDRNNYENPERRSSNSTHSCTSARYATYNSFDRHGVVRKSGTLNNIGGIVNGRNSSSSSGASSSSRPSGVQTLSTANHHPRGGVINGSARIMRTGVGGELLMIDPTHPPYHHHQRDSSDDQREIPTHPHRGGSAIPIKTANFYRDCQLERSNSAAMHQYIIQSDDDMVIGSNAERTNLINSNSSGLRGGGVDAMGPIGGIIGGGVGSGNSGGGASGSGGGIGVGSGGGGGGCSSSGITSSTSGGNLTDNGSGNGVVSITTGDRSVGGGCGTTGSSGMGSSSGESANSGSMLVAEHGFVRFRALDDINNAQGVGIHNASIRTTTTAGGRSKDKQRYGSNT